jgi:hypothetical protein
MIVIVVLCGRQNDVAIHYANTLDVRWALAKRSDKTKTPHSGGVF